MSATSTASRCRAFARERRVQLAYEEFPPQLINAFLAAEDRTFFSHGGIDYPGLIGAVWDYVTKSGTGERAVGGSTITQQVAKIFFTGNEYSVTRKIREALPRPPHRIGADQGADPRTLPQPDLPRPERLWRAGGGAGLFRQGRRASSPSPRAPFSPSCPRRRAITIRSATRSGRWQRRNWVLGEMARNGFITAAQRDEAMRQPLGTVRGAPAERAQRRRLFHGGGPPQPDRPLRRERRAPARTASMPAACGCAPPTIPRMQQAAETALRDGLTRYERGRGWRDPGLTIDLDGDWRSQLAIAPLGPGYPAWRAAVVLSKDGGGATLGFTDGSTGTLPAALASMPRRGTGGAAFDALRPGAVIAVEREGERAGRCARSPKSRAAWWSRRCASGRILAMQGGFDVRGSDFNRATQALRQPGSTFKPIVYSAALDNGMTPASIIIDGPFCANQGTPSRNASATSRAAMPAPQTMRWGLEQSRNLMTVRTANQIGMHNVVRRARQMGVGDYPAYLAIALGAGDTTVARMVNAFAIFANQGRALTPTADRLCPGPARPRHLPRRHPALRGLQRARLERPADAAAALAHPPGGRSDDRLSGRPHARRRRPARHRDHPARSRPAPVRQDRHHLRARPTSGSSAARPRSSPASIWASTGRGRWAATPRAARSPRRSSASSRATAFEGMPVRAVPRAARHPHGPDRPAHRPARVRRLAAHRSARGGDLGGVQAGERAAAHHRPRGDRSQRPRRGPPRRARAPTGATATSCKERAASTRPRHSAVIPAKAGIQL